MRKSNSTPSMEKILNVLNLGKVSLDLLSQKYDSNTIKRNVKSGGEVAKVFIPYATLASAAFMFVPWYAGALAFTIGGPTAAKTMYAASKIFVVGVSGVKGAEQILAVVGNDSSTDTNSSAVLKPDIATVVHPFDQHASEREKVSGYTPTLNL